MLMGQLKNIEELLLHTIAQQKKIEAQDKLIEEQGELLKALEAQIRAME